MPQQYKTRPDDEARQCEIGTNERLVCFSTSGLTDISVLVSSVQVRLLPQKKPNDMKQKAQTEEDMSPGLLF